MCRIQHRINKPVLITEEGEEKPACYPLMGMGMRVHAKACSCNKSKTHVSFTRGNQISVELYCIYGSVNLLVYCAVCTACT